MTGKYERFRRLTELLFSYNILW